MNLTPDQIIYWHKGIIILNATIVFTWIVMIVLVVASWLITHKLSASTKISSGQNLLEVLVQEPIPLIKSY